MILTSDLRSAPPTKRHHVCRWPYCGYKFLTPGELKRHLREAQHYGTLPAGQVMGQGITHGERKGPQGRRKDMFPWTVELLRQAQKHQIEGLGFTQIAEALTALNFGVITRLGVKAKLARARRAKLGLKPRADVGSS